jgi:hypothetical protein
VVSSDDMLKGTLSFDNLLMVEGIFEGKLAAPAKVRPFRFPLMTHNVCTNRLQSL